MRYAWRPGASSITASSLVRSALGRSGVSPGIQPLKSPTTLVSRAESGCMKSTTPSRVARTPKPPPAGTLRARSLRPRSRAASSVARSCTGAGASDAEDASDAEGASEAAGMSSPAPSLKRAAAGGSLASAGEVAAGWKVSITTLMNERLAVGEAPGPDSADILALARGLEIDGEPALATAAVRERLADWYVRTQGLKYTRFRSITALSRGQTPGPEASIAKVVSAGKLQEIATFGTDLLGMSGAVMDAELTPMQAWFQEAFLYAPGMRIAGGTDEILRNIIAERVLGLPGDVRVDKTLPFSQLPQGGAKG